MLKQTATEPNQARSSSLATPSLEAASFAADARLGATHTIDIGARLARFEKNLDYYHNAMCALSEADCLLEIGSLLVKQGVEIDALKLARIVLDSTKDSYEIHVAALKVLLEAGTEFTKAILAYIATNTDSPTVQQLCINNRPIKDGATALFNFKDPPKEWALQLSAQMNLPDADERWNTLRDFNFKLKEISNPASEIPLDLLACLMQFAFEAIESGDSFIRFEANKLRVQILKGANPLSPSELTRQAFNWLGADCEADISWKGKLFGDLVFRSQKGLERDPVRLVPYLFNATGEVKQFVGYYLLGKLNNPLLLDFLVYIVLNSNDAPLKQFLATNLPEYLDKLTPYAEHTLALSKLAWRAQSPQLINSAIRALTRSTDTKVARELTSLHEHYQADGAVCQLILQQLLNRSSELEFFNALLTIFNNSSNEHSLASIDLGLTNFPAFAPAQSKAILMGIAQKTVGQGRLQKYSISELAKFQNDKESANFLMAFITDVSVSSPTKLCALESLLIRQDESDILMFLVSKALDSSFDQTWSHLICEKLEPSTLRALKNQPKYADLQIKLITSAPLALRGKIVDQIEVGTKNLTSGISSVSRVEELVGERKQIILCLLRQVIAEIEAPTADTKSSLLPKCYRAFDKFAWYLEENPDLAKSIIQELGPVSATTLTKLGDSLGAITESSVAQGALHLFALIARDSANLDKLLTTLKKLTANENWPARQRAEALLTILST